MTKAFVEVKALISTMQEWLKLASNYLDKVKEAKSGGIDSKWPSKEANIC